jgi:hypothetical protein
MNAPDDSTAQPKVARSRFQFSLRVLLAAFTLFAIGFPIWYRWPFTEAKVQYPIVGGKPDKSKPPIRKTIVTWQRTWGGGKLRNGSRTHEVLPGFKSVEYYENDVLTGPYAEFYDGAIAIEGQFALNKRTGQWIRRNPAGEIVARTTWKEGRLDGPAELSQLSGKSTRLRFEAGALAEIDGRPAAKSWQQLPAVIERNSPRLAMKFGDPAQFEFVETPLNDALQILCDSHNIPAGHLRIDQTTVDVGTPITLELSEIGLLPALAVLTESSGMCCDYRYGCLWVTGPANGQEWVDPTGVAEIHPVSGSALAAAWEEPVTINTIKTTNTTQPLATILKSIASQAAVEIDSMQVETSPGHPQDYSTVLHLDKMPFHQALGVLLYETGCRCEMDDERLIVLPRERVAATGK